MDREAFERALDERPDDWGLRLVYADWLLEQGEYDLETAQRWMAENERTPWSFDNGEYCWSNYSLSKEDEELHGKRDLSEVSKAIYQMIAAPKEIGPEYRDASWAMKVWYGRAEAEAALAAALKKLTLKGATVVETATSE